MVVADRVVVELEARTDRYQRNIRNAEGVTTRSVGAMTAAIRTLTPLLAGIGTGLSIGGLVSMTQAWTDLNSRVVNAVGSINQGREVMARLGEIADRTYSSLEQTAEAFLQNSTALRELGYNTTQQLDVVESLNNALVISGARGDRARQVTEAFARAMALGELRGDELNTVIQNGGRVAEALAASMGVTTNQLRRLGMEGRITTRELFGITSQLEQLRAEADAMPAGLEDGFLRIRTSIFRLIGNIDEATGSTESLGAALIGVSDWLNENTDSIAEFFRVLSEGAQTLRESAGIFGDLAGFGRVTGPGYVLQILENFEDTRTEIERAENSLRGFYDSIDSFPNISSLSQELQNELFNIAGEFDGTAESAEETADKILDFVEVNGLSLAPLVSTLLDATSRFLQVADAAGQASDAIRNIPGGPVSDDGSGRGGLGQSRRREQAVAEATTAYVSEQERLASLTREQLTLEQERAKVLNEVAEAGGRITQEEATRLAQLRVAARASRTGGGGGSTTDRFAEALEAQRRQIEMLREETAVRAGLNPLVNDYGYALERLRIQQELENEATRAGLALTPDRVAAISMLAEEYANASVEAARLTEQQQDLKDTVEEWAGIMQSATRGFIDDLLEGKGAAEAFGNVLRNIGNQLINLGLNSLFSPAGVGGLFGGFRANGGPVSSGRSYIVGERGPELFTPSSGGRITANHDLGGGGANVTFAPQIDARGADVAAVARLEEVIIRQQAEFDNRVKSIVRRANKNWRAK